MYLRAGNTACPLSGAPDIYVGKKKYHLREFTKMVERTCYVFKADCKTDRRKVYPYTGTDGRICSSVSTWNYFKQ